MPLFNYKEILMTRLSKKDQADFLFVNAVNSTDTLAWTLIPESIFKWYDSSGIALLNPPSLINGRDRIIAKRGQ